jgi:hypothetical protein
MFSVLVVNPDFGLLPIGRIYVFFFVNLNVLQSGKYVIQVFRILADGEVLLQGELGGLSGLRHRFFGVVDDRNAVLHFDLDFLGGRAGAPTGSGESRSQDNPEKTKAFFHG